MDPVIQFLSDYNVIGILFTLVLTMINTLVVFFKVKKTKLEKEYINLSKSITEDFVPDDYLAYINGCYYEMSQVSFVKRSDKLK